MIEAFGEERLRFLRRTLDDRGRVGIHVVRDQARHRGRRCRRQLGRLPDHCVAGRDRRRDREKLQLHRIVPRRDHQHDTERLGDDARFRRLQLDRYVHATGLRPRVELRKHVVDLARNEVQLRGPRFDRRFAEVFLQRARKLIFALAQ